MKIRTLLRRRRRAAAVYASAVTAALPLLLAGPAAAATPSTTVVSSNWSGYADHATGTKYQTISARWRVPAATCVKGDSTYSAFWVGLGGYSDDATGLEQDGTELDCAADGTETVSAWYELLPAAAHTIKMTVKSGDLISSSVHVSGKEVTMTVSDLTRDETYSTTRYDSDVDETSAEWIAEAPAECTSDSADDCTVLPLADFGAVRFSNASTTTTAGLTSAITNPKWTTTKVLLGYSESDNAFVADSEGANATPSTITDSGREFEITWGGTHSSSSGTTGFPHPGGGLGGPA